MNLVILTVKTFGIFRTGKFILVFQGKDKTLWSCCRNIKFSGPVLTKVLDLIRPGLVFCFASSTKVLTFFQIRLVLEKQVHSVTRPTTPSVELQSHNLMRPIFGLANNRSVMSYVRDCAIIIRRGGGSLS